MQALFYQTFEIPFQGYCAVHAFKALRYGLWDEKVRAAEKLQTGSGKGK
jgi:hypothetical protein